MGQTKRKHADRSHPVYVYVNPATTGKHFRVNPIYYRKTQPCAIAPQRTLIEVWGEEYVQVSCP